MGPEAPHESTSSSILNKVDDYSDFASDGHQDQSHDRRKYQRGGRKAKAGKKSQRRVSDTAVDNEISGADSPDDVEIAGAGADEVEGKEEQKKPEPPSTSSDLFETGLRAFNIKRAAGSIGRPVEVRAQKSETVNEGKKAKSKEKRKKAMDESDESPGDSQADDEIEKQSPMKIRLDLNLVVEIFLRARIQGDVTITFME